MNRSRPGCARTPRIAKREDGLVPSRIQPNEPRVTQVLEHSLRSVGCQETQDGDGA